MSVESLRYREAGSGIETKDLAELKNMYYEKIRSVIHSVGDRYTAAMKTIEDMYHQFGDTVFKLLEQVIDINDGDSRRALVLVHAIKQGKNITEKETKDEVVGFGSRILYMFMK